MSETLTVELTAQQRELLLRGLRYVRSSHMLEVVDPSPEVVQQRQNHLQAVAALVDQLQKAKTPSETARV